MKGLGNLKPPSQNRKPSAGSPSGVASDDRLGYSQADDELPGTGVKTPASGLRPKPVDKIVNHRAELDQHPSQIFPKKRRRTASSRSAGLNWTTS
ncbi:MAG: hypothetical protein CMJ62_11675 [Planctomycetaceae bacterium]|nr:hypothetical protein [Planctomycetaceae bacterium]